MLRPAGECTRPVQRLTGCCDSVKPVREGGGTMKLKNAQAIDRLTLGPTPRLATEIREMGAADWVAHQLAPGNEPAGLREKLAGLEVLRLDPVQMFQRYWLTSGQRRDPEVRRRYRMQARDLYFQTASARLWQASESPWQLRELLVDFWFNHFNIFAQKGLCQLWTGSYEAQAIRPHVLGRFSDMLVATARHPAMLFYLDNWMNTAPGSPHARGRLKGLNENYARELMELHTVGLHYTQKDVAGATRLLTGWGLQRAVGFRFDPQRHDSSAQTILGRQFAGGEGEIIDFLHYLARRPETAQHVATQLAQYFVADQPPAELVGHMRTRFLDSGGDLKAVTEAMIEHPRFAEQAARRDKFRTPYRYVLALIRACGRVPDNTRPLIGTLYQLGQPLYGCVTPNGWGNTEDTWLSADALTARLNFAVALGGGWLPVSERRENMMSGGTNTGGTIARVRRRRPVRWETVFDALGTRLPKHVVAAAIRAPAPLRAAVLLGSPQMQYC